MATTGRNEPCPCGSGKKYKRCCADKAYDYGPCRMCGLRSSGAIDCKLCGSRHAHCHGHSKDAATSMYGHVIRMHPETLPPEKFDQLLQQEEWLETMRDGAKNEPEQYRKFFDFIEQRAAGKVPRDNSIEQDAVRHRASAMAKRGQMVRWYDGAWEFLLSLGNELPLWGLSAMLYPRGRGSTLDDWTRLGRWTAALGLPKGDREIGKTVDTVPNAVHKWLWMDKPIDATKDN